MVEKYIKIEKKMLVAVGNVQNRNYTGSSWECTEQELYWFRLGMQRTGTILVQVGCLRS